MRGRGKNHKGERNKCKGDHKGTAEHLSCDTNDGKFAGIYYTVVPRETPGEEVPHNGVSLGVTKRGQDGLPLHRHQVTHGPNLYMYVPVHTIGPADTRQPRMHHASNYGATFICQLVYHANCLIQVLYFTLSWAGSAPEPNSAGIEVVSCREAGSLCSFIPVPVALVTIFHTLTTREPG